MIHRTWIAVVLLTLASAPALAGNDKDLLLTPDAPGASVAPSAVPVAPQQEPFSPPAAASPDPAPSPADAGFKVKLWTDRPAFAIGERFTISFQSTGEGFAYVICVGTSGQSDLLFPNKKELDNRILANQDRTVPGKDAGYHVQVAGPPGVETVILLACTKQIDPYKHLSLIAPRRNAEALTLTGPPVTMANKDLNLMEDPAIQNSAVRLDAFLTELERSEGIDLKKDLACAVLSLTVKQPSAAPATP